MVLLSIYLSRKKGRQKKPQPNNPAQAVVKLLAPILFSTAFNYLRYINSSRIVESCRIILSDFLFYTVKMSGNNNFGILTKRNSRIYYNSRAPPSSGQFLKKARVQTHRAKLKRLTGGFIYEK